jgi:hypothetical protein
MIASVWKRDYFLAAGFLAAGFAAAFAAFGFAAAGFAAAGFAAFGAAAFLGAAAFAALGAAALAAFGALAAAAFGLAAGFAAFAVVAAGFFVIGIRRLLSVHALMESSAVNDILLFPFRQEPRCGFAATRCSPSATMGRAPDRRIARIRTPVWDFVRLSGTR